MARPYHRRPRQPALPNDDYSKTRSFDRRDGTPLQQRLRDALDPAKAPSKVKSFKDMTPEERAEMQRLYGKR